MSFNLKCLLFILIIIFSLFDVESFTPEGRFGHSSIIVDNKLYFFGDLGEKFSQEVFYVDLSKPFNAVAPSWIDISDSSTIPFFSVWTSIALINNDNDPNIYLIGGMIDPTSFEDVPSLTYVFNSKSGHWNSPITKGIQPKRRNNMKAIVDDTGKIYIFGGYSNTESEIFYDDMLILNTNDLTWSYGPIINVPSKRAFYSATLLTNGKIAYIGGYEQTNDGDERVVDINQINLYDIGLATWSKMVIIYYNSYNSFC